MVEKLTDTAAATATTTTVPFVSRKVKKCPSCDTINPGDATRCSGCGDALHGPALDTVAATCPSCLGERPFVPAGPAVGYERSDGTTGVSTETGEGYDGDCPHCHQSAYDAGAALEKLKKGDSSSWGKGAAH